jgi:hypothetical protein
MRLLMPGLTSHSAEHAPGSRDVVDLLVGWKSVVDVSCTFNPRQQRKVFEEQVFRETGFPRLKSHDDNLEHWKDDSLKQSPRWMPVIFGFQMQC